jgi:Protein of unknown function (DUF4230)
MRTPSSGSASTLVVLLITLVLGVGAGWVLANRTSLFGSGKTEVSQSLVVERLQSVAKLVTTEAMVRDVVKYQNTWLGSTKRSLVIVTGKALVGVDLQTLPKFEVNEKDRRITIELPSARLLGVDVIQLQTYDERRGLWNPFHPSDRDSIFLLARKQLARTADDLAVLEFAEQSATQLLTGLFAREGYAVEVRFPPRKPIVEP